MGTFGCSGSRLDAVVAKALRKAARFPGVLDAKAIAALEAALSPAFGSGTKIVSAVAYTDIYFARGVYDRLTGDIHLYERTDRGSRRAPVRVGEEHHGSC